jgi:hypothetical protein
MFTYAIRPHGRFSRPSRTLPYARYPYGYPPQRSTSSVVINFNPPGTRPDIKNAPLPASPPPTDHEDIPVLPLEIEVNNIAPGSSPSSPLAVAEDSQRVTEEQSPPYEESEDSDDEESETGCDDRCVNCGTDELDFVKEPSNDPDCHTSYCGTCNAIICV